MKQFPSVFRWKWLLYPSALFFTISSALNATTPVFAESGNPANMAQESLLQEQQELEKELDKYTKPDGTPRKVLDISRISQFGWKPNISLDVGISQTVKWYKENN